jgi:hypothetical protein
VSETITLSTSETETIHGTFALAKAYIAMMFGDAYDTWRNLAAVGAVTADDRKKQTLAAAVRYLNAQTWLDDYDTFAERDAVTAFATAQYELAVLIANDPSVVTALDSGSNIRAVSASGASVEYFAPTSPGNRATKLPPVIQRLLGSYLSVSSTVVVAGFAATGDCESQFSDCADTDRDEPY